jgi:hypothetical protein
MSNQPYVVVRLVPKSPIDGATFSTYLDNLALRLQDASTGDPLSGLAYASPLTVFQWAIGSNAYLSSASAITSASTNYSSGNYGKTLTFDSTDGISIGSYIFSADQTTIPFSTLTVAEVTATTVVLSGTLSTYVPAGTVVSFIGLTGNDGLAGASGASFSLDTNSAASTDVDGQLVVLHFADTTGVLVGMQVSGSSVASGTIVTAFTQTTVTVSQAMPGSPASVTFALPPPFVSFELTPSSGTPAAHPSRLGFPSGKTDGIAFGMILSPVPGLIAPGTTVTGATATKVQLSQPLLGSLPAGQAITFNFMLSSGIAQHTVTLPVKWNFFGGEQYAVIPAAVATAIIPLTAPVPDYLDIKISATRGTEIIPETSTYYNVKVSTDEIPATPDLYQDIPAADTSLYMVLPPPPGTDTIPLAIPSDGSAPEFGDLLTAMITALDNDPIQGAPTAADLINSSAWCTRIAYDIVWSYQNNLPPLPDPLESLYTSAINPGGGGSTTSAGGGGSNNYEQDRQNFEGALSSFYATRNATAERLAKFVAAASAAMACEQVSVGATGALLEFPVDPSATFAAAVESEILLDGLGVDGPSGLNFGVPAPFFYALGASLDKTTSAAQRFQMATGDAIERLLQQFATAEDAAVITDSESFASTALENLPPITSFQAARRLVALGVPAASTTPPITVLAGSPLAALVSDWLTATDPASTQNPPPGYQNDDFTIWSQQLAGQDPQGYLDLDLDTLTQGYVIPPFTASPSAGTASGSTLTFGTGTGIGVGMPVSGPGIAPGTTVRSVTVNPATTTTPATTTVTLSTAVTGSITTALTFNDAIIPSTLADQIAAWLPGTTSPATPDPTVATLKQVTAAQWTSFFAQPGSPTWLPPFTQPVAPGPSAGSTALQAGYVATRIRAFVRAVQQFFTVSTVATAAQLPPAGAAATFQAPGYDPIGLAAGGISFGVGALAGTDLATVAQTVFPGDPAAQAWLVQAMTTINELAEIASVAQAPTPSGGTLPYPVSFSFSVMEALYARGFRGAADITARPEADFQQALTGTVAYDSCDLLYGKAQNLAPASPSAGQPGGAFQPINPDGSLVDCVPPPCLSPTGPIAYLQEMLTVSELSSCDDLVTAPVTLVTAAADTPNGTSVSFAAPTLGTVLSLRRGPVGELAASCANLDTPLPLIDLANECLEYLAAAAPAAGGTVYDTAAEVLAGHALGVGVPGQGEDPAEDGAEQGHDPARLLAALPEHSTPAAPDPTDAAVEPAVFNKLKADFSSCLLPYSQALDVSRTYLGQLGSSRFEEIRTFRRCITEFVLDPAQEPAGFESWRWRYPVRVDTAIEYLGITPEEYATLFAGPQVPQAQEAEAPRGTIGLPEFLAETCLSYCEFYELWESGFVSFGRGAGEDDDGKRNSDGNDGAFPRCEPCCPEDLWLQFPAGRQEQDAAELGVFVRLWRKLRETCGGYSFAQLRDICDVLQLQAGGAANPDFIRQLAAFQMLRDDFGMDLTDPAAPVVAGAVDADRTHLLALWAGPSAAQWPWAVRQLITRVEQHAQRRHGCDRRPAEFVKLLTENLDPLSRLAGFDPDSATDSWHAQPTHTLRFAEVLAKIYASRFSVGELIFLFTADPHLDGDDPFPLQDENDALDSPLGLPDDEPEHALWRLRREMLEAAATEADGEDEADTADTADTDTDTDTAEWPWRRIEAALQAEFGFAPASVAALGQHLFPGVVARSAGQPGTPSAACFVSSLAAASTSAPMWNDPPDGPLRYDPVAEQLSARVPLTDRAVIAKLTGVRDLDAAEQQAVQDLFFQPRAMLAGFALLFADFAAAQRALIEEPDEACRFAYFRRQFLLCRRRSHLIASHLTRHVTAVTGQEAPDDDAAAALILRALAADENAASTSWEADSGAPPQLTWARPGGSALAALLGLAGTGMTAQYCAAGGAVAWRDGCGALRGFGDERDRENCPVPTVLPAFGATLTPQQLQFASVHNGFLMKDTTGAWLGGAQGFTVTWSGALLIERDGSYEFWAGPPVPGEDRPDAGAAGDRQWRVVLRRGQRTWVILSHHWDGEEEHPAAALPLKCGAYELTAELIQPAPEFGDDDEVRPQHTGFQVKYCGPDTGGRRTEIPPSALFAVRKDQPLADGIDGLSPGAAAYLGGWYASSLRDIRRTYQRAFKALLFCRRLGLIAQRQPPGTSELGYLLAQSQLFAGAGYYRAGGGFTRHAADLDFDFLPLRDDYRPPAPGADARTAPSPQRVQAMFDWWERLFDYAAARADVRRRGGRPLWHLFEEAQDKQPAHPGYLLRHMAADARHWQLDLRYFQGQNSPVYEVTSADLADDRWTLRAWHADRWLRAAQARFAARDIETARPDLWASDDPSAELPGETQTGNASLAAFVTDGCLENGAPRRYDDLRRLNDGLRDRGRRALIAYLCQLNRVPLPWQPGQFATAPGDLSDLLLLDVEAGLREKASRIEEAITAVQSFIRRSRLGLEPGWRVTREFARLWDSRFETYRIWERARGRELYQENWVEWDELAKARRIEAFRFLESQLRTSSLTLAAPGGLAWWADDHQALEHAPELLQRRVPSEIRALSTEREGLTTLGRPEYAAQPTWLAAIPQPSAPGGTGTGGTGTGGTGTGGTGTGGTGTGRTGTGRTGTTAESLAAAAAAGSTQSQSLPLWMESAVKLGTRFVRVAAAGVPQAALEFVRHGEEPRGACCRECGREHPAGVDEYYFWLINTQVYTNVDDTSPQGSSTDDTGTPGSGDASFSASYQFGFQDSYYDQFQQQSAEWDDEDQVPSLLAKWQSGPAVRLAWCRVHNGEFGPPRRSEGYVAVGEPPDLTFLGRAGDSLYFEVTGSAPLPPGYGADADGSGDGDPSPPGFRYDLPTDQAVALPQALEPPAPTLTYPGGLLAYPFFAYDEPGTRLFPASWFSTSLAVAGALRTRCGYELALRWYRRSFDPLQEDCAWVHCPGSTDTTTDAEENGRAENGQEPIRPGPCCDATQVTAQGARDRAVTLHYCRTLIEWGDALMRRGHSPEAFGQARVLYDTAARITGPRPRTIVAPEAATTSTVAAFVPAYAPLNPQLMELYDLVADRQGLIRRSLDGRRLRNGRPGRDMPYFGNGPAADRQGHGPYADECADDEDWCGLRGPYRFLSQIPKAIELAGRVRELGAALLSGYEKGDAEYLTSIHAEQEREMQTLGIAIRQDQWRDADWQVQALQQTKDLNQANLLYYAALYHNGLINNENQNLDLTTNALQTRTSANVTEAVGEIMNVIPDTFFGAMSSGASPPIGTKLAHLFEAVGRIMQTVADIQSTNAAMDMTQAGWQRRAAEWLHQMQTLPIEIQQIELQILGAHRRRDQALAELNNQQRQIEHAAEVLDFLRDKFTATELYLWLQKETAALHRQMYELARRAAREAERAFNFDLGHTRRRFLPEETWDSLHAGLMAGERLDFALHQMEKAYLDENRRELELTKHISLRLDFPAAYLRLRTTGYGEISIPEWMFDVDYPGHYLRRIKNVTLTLPCVTGPYRGVHCRLTLLSSMTRTGPEVRPAAQGCCCPGGREHSAYEPCTQDPRIVREYAAREAIATSSGQNDSGLFELSFRDERYLPFEYHGAVSRWRIELPPENNYFDLDTVTDLVLHLNYTAREGGPALREAAARDARGRLPGDGLRLFDVRHDFPDAWPALREPGDGGERAGRDGRPGRLRLGFTPAMFPFVPGRRVRGIDRLLLMFAAPDAVPGRHHLVRFWRDEAGRGGSAEVECVAGETWPGFFCGSIDLREHPLGPLRDDRPTACTFEIPAQAGEICSAFVAAHYDAQYWPRCGSPAEG